MFRKWLARVGNAVPCPVQLNRVSSYRQIVESFWKHVEAFTTPAQCRLRHVAHSKYVAITTASLSSPASTSAFCPCHITLDSFQIQPQLGILTLIVRANPRP